MSIRRPYKWFGAQRYGYENNRANQLLTFKAFANPSGVANLPTSLTINSTTKAASYIYYGNPSAGTWIPQSGGATLSLQAGAPTYSDGNPGLGSDDDSVKGDGTAYFQAGDTTTGNVGTNDFVKLMQIKATGTTSVIEAKRNAGVGWEIGINASDQVYLTIQDSGGSVTVVSAALTPDTWNLVMVIADRSGSGQIYVNGVASGAAVVISGTNLTLDSATSYTTLADSGGNTPYDRNIGYLASWEESAWLDSHTQTSLALELHSKATGTYPQVAAGTALPTTSTRAFPAYLDKVESDGTSKLYQVGSEWMRMCSRKDANGVELQGYLPEPQATNPITYSEQFDHANWAKFNLDAITPVSINSIVAPNGELTADGIVADNTSASHWIQQAVTIGASNNVDSFFLKKGSVNWARIIVTGISTSCYFDLANGVVGTAGGGAVGYIEPLGNNWYRCILSYTGDGLAHSVQIYSAEADGDTVFTGDGSTVSTYIWGAQHETTGLGYATSYIPTTSAAATRLKDQLEYVAGANIGGEDVGKGTIACDVLFPNYDLLTTSYLCTLSDGGAAGDRIVAYVPASDLFNTITAATAGNAGASAAAGDVVDGEIHQLRVRYKTDNLVVSNDGVDDTTPDTSCDMPDDLDRLDIGQSQSSGNQPSCLINSLRIYKDTTEGG